jgi:hypothetical protein
LSRASADAAGNLWIGAYEYGLVWFTPKTQAFTIRKEGFEHNNVICAQESKDENGKRIIFIGTNDGVSVFYPDRNELTICRSFTMMVPRSRVCLMTSANRILWIATNDGVYKYRYRNAGIRTVGITPGVVRLPVQVTSILPVHPAVLTLLGLSHSGALSWKPASNQFRFLSFPADALTDKIRWIMGRPFAFTDKGYFYRGHPNRTFYNLETLR